VVLQLGGWAWGQQLLTVKNKLVTKDHKKPRTWTDSLERWVDNIKIDLRETEWDGMDWIDLAQDRDQWRALVKMVMNLRVP
jgi:hypothetical protein